MSNLQLVDMRNSFFVETDADSAGVFFTWWKNSRRKKNTDSLASQGIAETIVFSLLQKQCHTEFENQLTPNIFNDRRSFRISMYNADGDCLLSMALYHFYRKGCLFSPLILTLSMVLHYKQLCLKLQGREFNCNHGLMNWWKKNWRFIPTVWSAKHLNFSLSEKEHLPDLHKSFMVNYRS